MACAGSEGQDGAGVGVTTTICWQWGRVQSDCNVAMGSDTLLFPIRRPCQRRLLASRIRHQSHPQEFLERVDGDGRRPGLPV